MKKVLVKQSDICGHVLAKLNIDYMHAVEFTLLDQAFVGIRSWNAPVNMQTGWYPCWPAIDWVLLSSMKMKKIHGRLLWKDMRNHNYFILKYDSMEVKSMQPREGTY